MWDSRAKHGYLVETEWPLHEQFIIGEHNAINELLVNPSKIIFPPLHIKCGIIKQMVKDLDKDGVCFNYVCNAVPDLSEKKKVGVFDGP